MDPTVRTSNNPTYRSWLAMRSRCLDPERKYYGGRGITYAPEWEDYYTFLRDMGPRPVGMTLDRISSDKPYEKGNCRWISPQGQANNRRSNRLITFRGDTKTVAEWAREFGLNYQTLVHRLNAGWSVEEALTAPLKRQYAGNQWRPE